MFYIVFGVIVFMITKSCLSNDYSNKSLEAFVYSQEVVESNLKSPSTAKFPTFSENFVYVNNNEYTINCYVDSKNSFGNEIRSYYKCVLIENNDLFVLKEFTIK